MKEKLDWDKLGKEMDAIGDIIGKEYQENPDAYYSKIEAIYKEYDLDKYATKHEIK